MRLQTLLIAAFTCFSSFLLRADNGTDLRNRFEEIFDKYLDQTKYLNVEAKLGYKYLFIPLNLLEGMEFSTTYSNFSDRETGLHLTATPKNKRIVVFNDEEWNLAKILYTITAENSSAENQVILHVIEKRFYEQPGWFTTTTTDQETSFSFTFSFNESVDLDLEQKPLFVKRKGVDTVKFALRTPE